MKPKPIKYPTYSELCQRYETLLNSLVLHILKNDSELLSTYQAEIVKLNLLHKRTRSWNARQTPLSWFKQLFHRREQPLTGQEIPDFIVTILPDLLRAHVESQLHDTVFEKFIEDSILEIAHSESIRHKLQLAYADPMYDVPLLHEDSGASHFAGIPKEPKPKSKPKPKRKNGSKKTSTSTSTSTSKR